MPISPCRYCSGGRVAWRWTDAFMKYGFEDGDGHVMTYEVCEFLNYAGYKAEPAAWGAHNVVIAKLEKTRALILKDRDIRRTEVLAGRQKAFQKMQRIHVWQNWLDEQRCRSYRDSDSDTRQWCERRDRWDVTKARPPLFGSIDITFYGVDEARDVRQILDDRRKLLEPLEMKRLPWRETHTALPAAKSPDDSKPAPPPVTVPDGPAPNQLPFVKRDPVKHAAEVEEGARQRMAERGNRERTRRTGRKRQPRPR